eukprot:1180342-Heterocapsa_arctica.AAC.1
MSTCPKVWCGWSQILSPTDAPKAVTANGSPLTIYDERFVRCPSWHGLKLRLKIIVSDVTRPIVAVKDMLDRGLVPTFEE